MHQFLSVFKYEFRMSIMRRSLLVVFLLFTTFFAYIAFDIGFGTLGGEVTSEVLLSDAAQNIFFLNLFFPVIAGIAAADRGVRDSKLGVREIIRSTDLSNRTYVLGKYFGAATSLLVMVLAVGFMESLILVALGGISPIYLLYAFYAGVVLNGPAIFFVTAFSLACPLIMPVRVYQILFTGYWYWGNFLSPNVMPTLSDTILHAAGKFSLQTFFGVKVALDSPDANLPFTIANILTLFFCAGLALIAMKLYLDWKESRI